MTAANLERKGNARVPTARNASYPDILSLLQELDARSIDIIVPAHEAQFVDGMLKISGGKTYVDDEGVTLVDGEYWPTQGFDDQLAERLDVPAAYLRRLRNGRMEKGGEKQLAPSRIDLWDANVNGLLGGRKQRAHTVYLHDEAGEITGTEQQVRWEALPPDSRSFYMRLLLGGGDSVGVARACLSNKFAPMDHVQGLKAMLDGVMQAGISPESLRITGDLSENRLRINVEAPEILAAAPELLAGYRSPFDNGGEAARRQGKGYSLEERIEAGRRWRESGRASGHHMYQPGTEPIVSAGFAFSNSETGFGRYSLRPRFVFVKCSNGLTLVKEGFARAHVGARQEDGMVEWSDDTTRKELALITAQTRDSVQVMLSQEFLETKLAEMTRLAGKEITEPEKTIEVVGKRMLFSKEETDMVLRHFLLGGQLTSGGVMQAVTSVAQTIADPDRAIEFGDKAIEVLELAFAMS